jgi:hypothetical protein
MKVDKKTARVAGILYVIIILGSVIGGIATEMYMQSQLAGGAADPANTMLIPEEVYRGGFAVYLLVYLSDLATAAVLYILLKPVDRGLALLAAFFRLAEAVILGMNMLNHYHAFLLVSGGDSMAVFQPDQVQALASAALHAHRAGYLISQVFFGFHCLFLGLLLIKSGYFPKVIGVFLMAASVGYLTESFSYFLLPNYQAVEAIISWIGAVPAILAEFALTYWLLFKGADIERRYQAVTTTT